MLATLSPERGHLDESISTSRFAQRVGMVKNSAQLNEEVDPYVLVKQMKGEMREMREELAAFRGQAKFKPLDAQERLGIQEMVQLFLRDDRHISFNEDGSGKYDKIVMPNPYKVRAAFECWKEIVTTGGGSAAGGTASKIPSASPSGDSGELRRLQHENSLLAAAIRSLQGSAAAEGILKEIQQQAAAGSGSGGSRSKARDAGRASASASLSSSAAGPPVATPAAAPAPSPAELALARARADSFERFRRTYRKHSMIEEQKTTHSTKVEQARAIGEQINEIRGHINATKQKIEAHRLQRGVQTLSSDGGGADASGSLEPDSTELHLRSEIDRLKALYRTQFETLKHLKSEIDFLKNVIEKSRQQLQADFERWWATQEQAGAGSGDAAPDQQQQQHSAEAPISSGSLRTAAANIASSSSSSQTRSSAGTSAVSSSYSSSSSHAPRMMSDAASIAAGGATSSYDQQRSRERPLAASNGPADPRSASTRALVTAWAESNSGAAPSSSTSSSGPLGGLRTTGNSAADADIARFYELKQQMLNAQQQQQRR